MSYVGTVSPTVNVQVTLATYLVSVGIYDVATSEFIAGTIVIDGTIYPNTEHESAHLTQGTHLFYVEPPTGYEFVKWQILRTATEEIISESTTRTLNWNVTEPVWIYAAVQQLALINTSLTITAPTSVDPGAPISFTGKLKRTDTGAGLPGQVIVLEQPPGTAVKSGVTDSNGNYSLTVTAPTTPGSYPYRTSFATSAGLAGTQSKVMGIGVGIPPVTGILPIAAIIAVAWSIFKK